MLTSGPVGLGELGAEGLVDYSYYKPKPMWRSLAGSRIKLGQFTVLSYAANPDQPKKKQLKLVRMSGGAE